MKNALLFVLFIIVLFSTSCKKEDSNPVTIPPKTYNIEKEINSSQGGVVSLGDSIVLNIPASSLPNSGNVFLGRTGNEPTNVTNNDYKILGTPITVKLPVDSIKEPLQLSFPKPAGSITNEDICTFMYDGDSYYPIQSSIQNGKINVTIDNINWGRNNDLNKLNKVKQPEIITQLIILVLIQKQTPPTEELGIKEVSIVNGEISYLEPTVSQSSKIVLLIHGWTSRPKVWKTMITRLQSQINPKYADILTFGYNSSFSVESNANLLSQALSSYSNGIKIDIIAHSMGGLVARSMIEKYNGAQYINKLITLGTPHHGSPLAALRGWLGSLVNMNNPEYFSMYNYFTQGFNDLAPTSTLIQSLSSLTSPSLPYYLIAGVSQYNNNSILPGADDGVVTEVSALGVSGAAGIASIELNYSILLGLTHTLLTESGTVYDKIISYLQTSTTTNNPPSAPSIPSPSNNAPDQPTSLTLSWSCSDPDGDNLKYDVYFGTSSNPTTTIETDQISTSISRSGLTANKKYYWKVLAKDQSLSTASPVWNFTTAAGGTAPSAPTLSSPENNEPNVSVSPTLSWSASIGATYTLQVSTFSNFSSYTYEKSGITNTSQQITGLSNNTLYYWRVNATNSYGTSSYSTVYKFTTIASSVTASISGKVTISTMQGNPISNAKIYTSPATTTVYSDASGNYSITSVAAGTYTVYAEKTGYNNYSMSINIAQGQTYTQNIVMIATSATGTPCPGIPTITDSRDGKTYNTVQIGGQCWLKENLNVGTRIDGSAEQANNSTIDKYCYDDVEANCTTYGGLYQWAEAVQYKNGATNSTSPSPIFNENVQGICPTGWHIPTKAEFETLKASSTVNSNSNTLKAVSQGTGDGAGTNTSGFSALLAGYHNHNGNFNYLGSNAFFWSSAEYDASFAYILHLNNIGGNIDLYDSPKESGFSVRCLKN